LEFSGLILKTNRNLNIALFLQNQEYLEWLELVYQFTVQVIGSNISYKLTVLQNLIRFWAYFFVYATNPEIAQAPILSEYINKVKKFLDF